MNASVSEPNRERDTLERVAAQPAAARDPRRVSAARLFLRALGNTDRHSLHLMPPHCDLLSTITL